MSSEASSSNARPHATLSFDIEGSGGLRAKNQLLSWGWCLKEADGTQNKGQVALYLGKLDSESWGELWRRNGWDMDCFDGFWSKNLDKLEPLQISPDTGFCSLDDGTVKHVRYVGMESFLDDLDESESRWTGDVEERIVIESESYHDHVRGQKLWRAEERVNVRAAYSPIFYIRAYTERQLAFVIHDVLKELQSRYKITYVSDTLHYDASWTDMLLEKYGFPPLLYDQSGDMSYKRMCWGRELGSFVMGMSATNNRADSKDQYTKTKRLIEGRVSNGWDEKNSHFAVDDALKINGSWEEVERENRRRFKLHQRVANAIRAPVTDKEATEDEKDLTPEQRAEKRDSRPNWVLFYDFIESAVENFCEMAETHSLLRGERAAKRQRK